MATRADHTSPQHATRGWPSAHTGRNLTNAQLVAVVRHEQFTSAGVDLPGDA